MDIPNIDRNIKITRLFWGSETAKFTGEDFIRIDSFYLKVLSRRITDRHGIVIESIVCDNETNLELYNGRVFPIYLNNISEWEYCEHVPKVNVDLSALDEDSLIPEDLYK